MESDTERRSFVTALTVLQFIAILQSKAEVTWSCYEETGSCYYLPDIKLSYSDASCHCRSAGGHIWKIDSIQERDFVTRLYDDKQRFEGFYIGATDLKEEGHFTWEDVASDTGLIPWHYWGGLSSEPDNYLNSEQCVMVTNKLWWLTPVTNLTNYDAFDVTCAFVIYTICEKSDVWIRHVWNVVSRDQIYPSEVLAAHFGVTQVECADICTRNCKCRSFSYRQINGHCILYDTYSSRMPSPQISAGFVNYE